VFWRDPEMIELTRVDDSKLLLNAELIKWIEGLPRTTTITLVTENKLMVKETVTEIVRKVVDYKRLINIYQEESNFEETITTNE
jgi:flagellar protein FlbD|tara:strand:+ start:202 stop:453 length:252 start_codon:yes stop_codon:yes gene_type:complete